MAADTMNDKQKEALQRAADHIRHLEQRIQQFRSSQEFLDFLKAMSRFHRYSFRNQLLILAQKPDATQVAGFHTWKQLGRFVRRGEKGIGIYVPLKRVEHDEETEEDKLIVSGYSIGYVFDIAQTNGDPLPDIDLSLPNQGPRFYAQCLMLAEKRGVTVMTRESMHADGISRGGTVLLRKNSNPTYMAATLLHELAHETLHHDSEGTPLSKEARELEAETVAYLVADHFGVEIPAHKYLATWQKTVNLMDSLQRISECATAMMDDLADITKAMQMPITEVVSTPASNVAFL